MSCHGLARTLISVPRCHHHKEPPLPFGQKAAKRYPAEWSCSGLGGAADDGIPDVSLLLGAETRLFLDSVIKVRHKISRPTFKPIVKTRLHSF